MSNHHEDTEAHAVTMRHRQDAQHAAEIVCHDEQVTVWSGEIVGALSMGDHLREDATYEDVLDINRIVAGEVRRIVESALGHPALEPGRQSLAEPPHPAPHPGAERGETP